MPSTLVDAGIIIALLRERDRDHAAVVELIRGFRGTFFTTWPAVAEACAMMPLRRQGRVLEWLRVTATEFIAIDDGLEVVELLMTAYMSAEQGRTLDFPPPGLDTFIPAVAQGTWKP